MLARVYLVKWRRLYSVFPLRCAVLSHSRALPTFWILIRYIYICRIALLTMGRSLLVCLHGCSFMRNKTNICSVYNFLRGNTGSMIIASCYGSLWRQPNTTSTLRSIKQIKCSLLHAVDVVEKLRWGTWCFAPAVAEQYAKPYIIMYLCLVCFTESWRSLAIPWNWFATVASQGRKFSMSDKSLHGCYWCASTAPVHENLPVFLRGYLYLDSVCTVISSKMFFGSIKFCYKNCVQRQRFWSIISLLVHVSMVEFCEGHTFAKISCWLCYLGRQTKTKYSTRSAQDSGLLLGTCLNCKSWTALTKFVLAWKS